MERWVLWEAIDWVPDLQCAWQKYGAMCWPPCHHFVRTLPPSESHLYVESHDTSMMETMRQLLGGSTRDQLHKHVGKQDHDGWTGDSCWQPSVSPLWHLANLADDLEAVGCLGELEEATRRLDHERFVSRP